MEPQSTVLIIDDTATNIGILSACLQDTYHLKTAKSGKQGLKLANESPKPDLILLDVEMPGMNGYEVCQQLKSDSATFDIPVIFVTGRLDIKDEEKGFASGAVDYITKPIHPPLVIARVDTHITLKIQKDKLERMAMYDQLTELYNRHFLFKAAKQKISSSLRHEFPLSVMIIDIDLFKSINDTHGHPSVDAVIRAIAKTLTSEFRGEDIAARFGGEEFVVVMCNCDLENAKIKAEQLRDKIEKLRPIGINTTVSIGLSQLDNEQESFAELLEKADHALYTAKESGRNQVAFCG